MRGDPDGALAPAPAASTSGRVVGTGLGSASAGIAAALTATVASVCCTGPLVAPVVVALLGASGAAAAAGLKPFAPYLFGGSLLMLAIGFYTTYAPTRTACPIGTTMTHRPAIALTRAVLWVAAAVWLASAAFTVYSLRSV